MWCNQTGKQARSAEDLCPAGVPLTMPSGDRPFLCGLQVGQPQCPQLFDCIVQPGMCYYTANSNVFIREIKEKPQKKRSHRGFNPSWWEKKEKTKTGSRPHISILFLLFVPCFIFIRCRLRSVLYGRWQDHQTGHLSACRRSNEFDRLRSPVRQRHGMPRSRQVLPQCGKLRR